MTELIPLARVADRPHKAIISYSPAYSEQEALEWAARNGADTVWVFLHQAPRQYYTAWIMPKKEG